MSWGWSGFRVWPRKSKIQVPPSAVEYVSREDVRGFSVCGVRSVGEALELVPVNLGDHRHAHGRDIAIELSCEPMYGRDQFIVIARYGNPRFALPHPRNVADSRYRWAAYSRRH